jgi:RNA polymerase sigma-70 factor (ECF subfamily)
MDSDLALLVDWRSGDRRAGELLFARHFAAIYRFFAHRVGDVADELAQQTFLACVAARDRFRAQSTFRTYLFAIARKQLCGYLRRGEAGRKDELPASSLAEVITSIATRIGRAEQAAQLHAALTALPADDRMLLELHYWQELDAAALAEVFETSPGAIRVRLVRARRALHERLVQLPSTAGKMRSTRATL